MNPWRTYCLCILNDCLFILIFDWGDESDVLESAFSHRQSVSVHNLFLKQYFKLKMFLNLQFSCINNPLCSG